MVSEPVLETRISKRVLEEDFVDASGEEYNMCPGLALKLILLIAMPVT